MENKKDKQKSINFIQRLSENDKTLVMLVLQIIVGFVITSVIIEHSITFAQIFIFIPLTLTIITIGAFAVKFKINVSIASVIAIAVVFGTLFLVF